MPAVFAVCAGAVGCSTASPPFVELGASSDGGLDGSPRDDGGATSLAEAGAPDAWSAIVPPTDAGDLASQLACDARIGAAWKASPPSVGLASASAAASYDAVIGAILRDYQVPGGAVAVVSKGQLVFAKGYGFADRDAPSFVQPDSVFRIASLSKQITSAAILVLVQRGLLTLSDTPFTRLALSPLGGATANARLSSITVQNLLQHTGGWNRDVEGDPMFESALIARAAGQAAPPDCATIARYMQAQPTTYAPGTTYDYSNLGYCVLGLLVENVTRTDYATWVKANVLAPAGANGIVQGATARAKAVDGEVAYYDDPGAPLATSVFPDVTTPVPWPYGGFFLEAMAAHGAWVASPIDLLRFQTALDGRNTALAPLLTSNSLASLVANPNVPAGTASGGATPASASSWYSLGWQINTAGNWWHTGSLPGTATEQVHAADGFGWAAFFNSRPQDADGFAARLDRDLWTARNGVSAWPAFDLFPQYGAPGDWIGADAMTASVASQQTAGKYPRTIEGRLTGSEATFRAAFAPAPGVTSRAAWGLPCLDFEATNQKLQGEGYAFGALQSFVAPDGARRYQATWVKL